MTGNRGGVTHSKGTGVGSRTQVRCRASAHGTRTVPTELKGSPYILAFEKNNDYIAVMFVTHDLLASPRFSHVSFL